MLVGSKLQGVEGAMDGGQRVWAPHPEGGGGGGYKLGLIVDVSTDTLTVDPLQGGKVSSTTYGFTSMDAVSTTLVSCCA